MVLRAAVALATAAAMSAATGDRGTAPLSVATAANAAAAVVHLPGGQATVVGRRLQVSNDDDDDGGGAVGEFLGMPYTAKPLGRLRFAPAEALPLRGHVDATAFGSPCLQSANADPNQFPDPEAPPPSEDCLYLNVWSPHANATASASTAAAHGNATASGKFSGDSSSSLLPVMVWIHGGGFGIGTGSEAWFNGTTLAQSQNVLVVTLNYRLGPLGFLATEEAEKAYGHGSGGMNGINDQIVALQWLREHVGHFGGDPDAVTVFGQSAGGMAACILAVSPLAHGLLRNIIVESGPCVDLAPAGWGPADEAYAANVSRQFMESVNATTLDELRSLNASLMQWPDPIANDADFPGYFLDRYVMPDPPAAAYARGDAHVDNVIVGFNSKDGTTEYYGVAPFAANDTACGTYAQCLDAYWGAAEAPAVLAQYPPARYNDSNPAAFIQADADYHLICPSLRLAGLIANASSSSAAAAAAAGSGGGQSSQQQAARTKTRVFVYHLAHYKAGIDVGAELGVVDARNRHGWASHGADIPFVFGTTTGPDLYWGNKIDFPFAPAERRLSETVQEFWGQLAHAQQQQQQQQQQRQQQQREDKMTPARVGQLAPLQTQRVAWPEWDERGRVLTLRTDEEGGLVVEPDFREAACAFWAGK